MTGWCGQGDRRFGIVAGAVLSVTPSALVTPSSVDRPRVTVLGQGLVDRLPRDAGFRAISVMPRARATTPRAWAMYRHRRSRKRRSAVRLRFGVVEVFGCVERPGLASSRETARHRMAFRMSRFWDDLSPPQRRTIRTWPRWTIDAIARNAVDPQFADAGEELDVPERGPPELDDTLRNELRRAVVSKLLRHVSNSSVWRTSIM